VESSVVRIPKTPSLFVMNSSKDKISPTSSLFSRWGGGALSEEKGLAKNLDILYGKILLNFLSCVHHSALSQWSIDFLGTRSGLSCQTTFWNCFRALMI
jgi:hypothetical protein